MQRLQLVQDPRGEVLLPGLMLDGKLGGRGNEQAVPQGDHPLAVLQAVAHTHVRWPLGISRTYTPVLSSVT